jgi:hypothetical protein
MAALRHCVVTLGYVCAVTLGTGSARAQAPGIELGLRLGYGIPLGSAIPGSALNKNIAGEIPVLGELGYRIDPNWMVGAYGMYGFGFLTGDERRICDANHVSCSASDLRVGAQIHYHIVPLGKIDPWVGIGFGYEWLTANGNLASNEAFASATVRGWEFVNLQGGVDWVTSHDISIGPFVSFSFAEYTNVSTDCSGPACGSGMSASLDSKALHNWVIVGLRGAFLCASRGRGAPCPVR